ncbi:MAG: hypothetical protein U0871_16985 [Gemmataceae bacterium]
MPHVRRVTVEPTKVTPAEAVVTVRVEADGPVRGRLVGPYLSGVTTVAVAYPLRPLSDDPLTLTAVIPEPNLWTPDAPFHYTGTVEAGGEVSRFRVEVRMVR